MDETTPATAAEAPGSSPPTTEGDGGAPNEDLPVTSRDLWATAALLGFFLIGMVLALLFAQPFTDAGLQAFEDPEDTSNVLWYFLLLLAFTGLILWLAKRGHKWVIQVVVLAAVVGTLVYVVPPLLFLIPGMSVGFAWGLGLAVGLASALALYFHPEWYVIDAVGVLVAAGAASVFGISLGLVPVVVLLAALAIYDAIAVYRTKHMLALADSVMELRLPVLLVVPKHWGYRFRDEVARFKKAAEAGDARKDDGPDDEAGSADDEDAAEPPEERDALFMGLGDLVMPTILVVSAKVYATGGADAASLGAAIGTFVGFGVLMTFVLKGRPQAGLPLLNGGAILGFLVGLYAATGSLVFW